MLGARAATIFKKGGDDAESFANNEYGNYQSHLANLLMMGTLIFGFCVTGTFLSVTYTGEEPFTNNKYLVNFVKSGLRATIAALTATVLAFTVSTRLANQYTGFGALAAHSTVKKTLFFIGLAEILLYISLYQFVESVENYSFMSYMGPKLCPQQNADDPPTKWSNSSFCAQLGDDLHEAAKSQCGAPQDVTWLTMAGKTTEDEKLAKICKGGRIGEVMCNYFDCFEEVEDQWWFGWDAPDPGSLKGFYGNAPMTADEVWFRVAKESSEGMCGKEKANALMTTACTMPAIPTLSQIGVCSQARSAYLQADDCAGAKQDDALKCRKVCSWYQPVNYYSQKEQGDEQPLKMALGNKLKWYFQIVKWIIFVVAILRGVAALIMTVHACKADGLQALWSLDLMGLTDTCFAAQLESQQLLRVDDSASDVDESARNERHFCATCR